MATQEQITKTMQIIEELKPRHILDKIAPTDVGLLAVIKYLKEAKELNKDVHSVDISNFLNVSSARVTVLLKKLENKGIIKKEKSKNDTRTIIIELTDKGYLLSKKIKENLQNSLNTMIDEFGYNELLEALNYLSKLKSILDKQTLNILEELND